MSQRPHFELELDEGLLNKGFILAGELQERIVACCKKQRVAETYRELALSIVNTPIEPFINKATACSNASMFEIQEACDALRDFVPSICYVLNPENRDWLLKNIHLARDAGELPDVHTWHLHGIPVHFDERVPRYARRWRIKDPLWELEDNESSETMEWLFQFGWLESIETKEPLILRTTQDVWERISLDAWAFCVAIAPHRHRSISLEDLMKGASF